MAVTAQRSGVPTSRRHAVVIGASMAGLVAARVLADTYERVTVLDRDGLPATAEPRRGVPQGRHPHALLSRGLEVLEELFPGLTDELIAEGAQHGDPQEEFRWCNDGHVMCQAPSGLDGMGVARPRLEGRVRGRLASSDNVTVLARHQVTGLLADPDGRRVTGVRCVDPTDDHGGPGRAIAADLVIDTSGRGSRSPQWLNALGYPTPRTDEVRIGVAYATRTYRREPHHMDGDAGTMIAGTVANPRHGIMLAFEEDRWLVGLAGYAGDDPPLDPDGFLAFAASLPHPGIHDVISDARPLDDPVRYRFPASVRHRYEHLPSFPDGYLVFGDAVCSFNPVYGQGMTVAAGEALVLRDCLRRGSRRLAPRFFRRAAKLIDIPWDMAVGADLRFEFVEGRRTSRVRAINAYMAQLYIAATTDPVVGRTFLQVANLVARPEKLLTPTMLLRVLRGTRRAVAPVPLPRPLEAAQ